MRTLVFGALMLTLAACGDDDRRPSDASIDGATDATHDIGADDTGTDDTGFDTASDTAADVPGVEGLSIVFDYRYDDAGFFADPARRAALEAAAAVWSSWLTDDFEDIPAGTSIRTRDPEDPTASGMSFPSDATIDDVLIFVGCASFTGGIAQSNHAAAIGSVADASLAARLQERYEGATFQPWTGWISFGCDEPWFFDATPDTDDDIPGGQNDFHSTAVHEIGHVLGFGTSEAFAAFVVDQTFTGTNAVEVFGGPVPMTASGVHWQSSVLSDGQVTLMDVSRTVGTRTPPTRLDRAAMADLGYQLR